MFMRAGESEYTGKHASLEYHVYHLSFYGLLRCSLSLDPLEIAHTIRA